MKISFPFILACLGAILLGTLLSDLEVSLGMTLIIIMAYGVVAMKIVLKIKRQLKR